MIRESIGSTKEVRKQYDREDTYENKIDCE